jgi:hypothetical protein
MLKDGIKELETELNKLPAPTIKELKQKRNKKSESNAKKE